MQQPQHQQQLQPSFLYPPHQQQFHQQQQQPQLDAYGERQMHPNEMKYERGYGSLTFSHSDAFSSDYSSPNWDRRDSWSAGEVRKSGRVWRCPVPTCGRSYRFKGDLKYHVIQKHAELPSLPNAISRPRSAKDGKDFPCPDASCRSGFKWERDLKRHIKQKHADLESEWF